MEQRHGLATHRLTVGVRLLHLVFARSTMMALSFVATALFFSRRSFWLATGGGKVYVGSNAMQAAIALLFLGVQHVARQRARQGKRRAARMILVPAFELILWLLYALTMFDLYIITCESPNLPHFAKVIDVGVKSTPLDWFLFFVHALIITLNVAWLPYFLFVANSLCRNAIVKAFAQAVAASTVCSALSTASFYLVTASPPIGWMIFLFSLAPASTLAASIHLLHKGIHSSRHSLIPYSLMGCTLCIVASVVGCFLFVQAHNKDLSSTLASSFATILGVLIVLGHNFCLYYSMYHDTKYWRGQTRKPIWCANAISSPYEQLDDSLIQNEIPALIEHNSINFIDFAFLRYGQVIGVGSTSRVFKGGVSVGPLKGQTVAIKVFTPIEISSSTLTEFANEIAKYSRLKHPRIMQLHGVSVCPPDVCMVCEYCDSGSLHDWLHSKLLPPKEKLRVCLQMAEAVSFIHALSPSVLHRDLKSQNFLVTTAKDIKLSDFGASVEIDGNEHTKIGSVGSLEWMSPEAIQQNCAFELSSDVYSLGVVFWEVWAQEDPYTDIPHRLLANHVLHGGRPQISAAWPKDMQNLIAAMWHSDPQMRPTAQQVLEALESMQQT